MPKKGEQSMATADNKAVLRRYAEEIFNQGKLAVIDEVIAPNVTMRISGAPEMRTREDFRTFASQFRASFPGMRFTIEDLVTEGDLVAVHWTFRGTHGGEYLGIAPTGKAVTITASVFYRLRNGQIEQAWGD
jgi:steroid delta-isomerase-like uncharacterized protein